LFFLFGVKNSYKPITNTTWVRVWLCKLQKWCTRLAAASDDRLIFGVQRHFQQYFSYIMATSFSGGRSRSTRREPPTMRKQLVNFITSCMHNIVLFKGEIAKTMGILIVFLIWCLKLIQAYHQCGVGSRTAL
jgi:hypothetical protein